MTLLAFAITFLSGLLVGSFDFKKPRFIQSPIMGLLGTAAGLLIYRYAHEIKTPIQFFVMLAGLIGFLALGLFMPKIFRFFRRGDQPRGQNPETKRRFNFKFQRHPFDDWQRFQITADDQTKADALAQERFAELFSSRNTVMAVFYRA